MIRTFPCLVTSLLLLALSVPLLADDPPAPAKPTGKRWLDMDYGPFLTTTVEAAKPNGNFSYKGIVVRVGGKRNETIVFDTDTLRYAAGWSDGYVKLTGVVYDGAHWSYPATQGPITFSNGVGPGVGKPGLDDESAFTDPRFRGRDDKPYGPLPRDWAHWKGLYVHGDSVVSSYSVGAASVLEMPHSETLAGETFFTRTIQAANNDAPVILRVCDTEGMRITTGTSGGIVYLALTSAENPRNRQPVDATELAKGLVAQWTFDDEKEGRVSNTAGKSFGATLKDAKLIDGLTGKALELTDKSRIILEDESKLRLGKSDHTIAAWVRTKSDGTIIARAPAEGIWKPQGRSLFIRGGKLTFDVGWVGAVESTKKIADDKWHHVAATFDAKATLYRLYVDGRADNSAKLKVDEDDATHVTRLGYTSTDFPSPNNRFKGAMDDVRIYSRTITDAEVSALANAGPPADDAIVLGCITGAGFDPGFTSIGSRVGLVLPSKLTSPHKLLYWRGDRSKFEAAIAALKDAKAPADLTPLTKGGPARWTQKLTTQATLGKPKKDSPWVTDTLTWPDDNPWRSWMRFGGFDFFKDQTKAAICTWSGDVWLVTGIKPGEQLGELTWQRIATGLFQPLGLRIVDDQIYVCGRDQVTKLVDLNGDGETDFYENFNNDHQVTEHFHEFAMDLQTDAEGNFYYAKSARHALDSLVRQHGTLIKISKDGKTSTILANGYRAANGVGVSPDGSFFTSDQEGHWMPTNRINLVRPGSFSGNMFSYHPAEKPTDYDRPIVWLPKGFDRSPAEQVYVPDDRWGLPKGSVISLSYGTGQILSIMYEKIDGVKNVSAQGAAVRIGIDFPTGIMRGRFHGGDGQLYACGLFGWGGDRTTPGGFYRIRHTGAKVHMPSAYTIVKDGIVLRFTDPLDKETALDTGSYLIEQWNYKWTEQYGSPEFKLDGQRGRDTLKLASATLSKDARSVLLTIPGLQPSMQVRIKYDLDAADGAAMAHDVYGSIFVVPNRDGKELLNVK